MATDVLGLPIDEIDRLLSEAEARLAANGVPNAAIAVAAPAAKALTTTSSPSPTPTGDQTAVSKAETEKLSVRVAQPAQNKKTPKTDLGIDWYNMPRTNLTPALKRDLQILRMRDVVAMGKQFFKKDQKRDLVPEFCQVGTIIAGATDSAKNRLTRKEKKQTIVEEVLAGGTTAKFKSKYGEIQQKNQSGRKGQYKKMLAGRHRK